MSDSKSKISPLKTAFDFLKIGTCSETLMNVINRAFDNPLIPEENASMPLAGGIMQHGYQCGMIWGATLAAGAQAYRKCGAGPEAETRALIAAQKLIKSFSVYYNTINCLEITDIDKSSSTMKMIMFFLIKGGTIGCMRMSGKYAPKAYNDIKSVLDQENIEVPASPVSCASVLVQKMGGSEMQAVMASGFAGGIGFSGGACGALGAAIWLLNLKQNDEGPSKIQFKNPQALELIDKFLKCTDYKFKCSEIVGRKFENVNDHACYLHNGGCREVINVLAKG